MSHNKIRRPRYWLRNMQHGKTHVVSSLKSGILVAAVLGWSDYQIHGRSEFSSRMGDWVVDCTPMGSIKYRGGNGLAGAQEYANASLSLQA